MQQSHLDWSTDSLWSDQAGSGIGRRLEGVLNVETRAQLPFCGDGGLNSGALKLQYRILPMAVSMPRDGTAATLRIEFPGAIHHVTSRMIGSWVGSGETVHFNKRHGRHGHLFDGRYKAKLGRRKGKRPRPWG